MIIRKKNEKRLVTLNYESLWLKIFMDSGSCDNRFYGKEIYIAAGLAGDKFRFFQLLGNIGGYSRDNSFDKDVDVVVLPNKLLNDLEEGIKDPFLVELEESLNAPNTPYKKLMFTTEELTLAYLTDRAKGTLNGSNEDTQSLNQIKAYKASAKEPKQQQLFSED